VPRKPAPPQVDGMPEQLVVLFDHTYRNTGDLTQARRTAGVSRSWARLRKLKIDQGRT